MNIFKSIKKLFSRKDENIEYAIDKFSVEEFDEHYDLKKIALEVVLGEMYPMVGHAIIPFQVGGAVDMYYFTNHIPGTAFATMELIQPDGSGPRPNEYGTYELLAFTKYAYDAHKEGEPRTEFEKIERRVCGIFTAIGFYSFEATLKPGETCQLPNDKPIYLVFDRYQPNNVDFKIGSKKHHLLLCIEVYENEMNFSRENGSTELFKKLKEKGFYPYSDMDREPVV